MSLRVDVYSDGIEDEVKDDQGKDKTVVHVLNRVASQAVNNEWLFFAVVCLFVLEVLPQNNEGCQEENGHDDD